MNSKQSAEAMNQVLDLIRKEFPTQKELCARVGIDCKTLANWRKRNPDFNIEMELNRKLILPSQRDKYVIEFDTSVLLRTDKTALAEYWTKMFSIGAATPNEVRQRSNLEPIEGGDSAFVQVNVQPIKKAVADFVGQ